MYRPDDARPGDVVLVEGRGPLAAVIRWATVCPMTHAAIVGPDGWTVEALWEVSRTAPGRYAATGWLYRVSGATTEQRQRAAASAASRLGARYGFAELLEDGGRDLLHLPLTRRLGRGRTCSGLVAWAWLQAGVHLTYAPLPSPADLAFSPLLAGYRPWLPAARTPIGGGAVG